MTTPTIPADRLHAIAGRVPGVTVVVVGPDGVRIQGSSGWASLNQAIPMSTQVAIPWFSMTKIATATLAVRLEAEGRVDLDEPIAGLVDEVARLKPTDWATRITRRHLLMHTSGLANPMPIRWIHPQAAPAPDQDQFLSSLLAKHDRLRREPGLTARYSNLGTLVLAASLSRAVDVPFETLIRQTLLEPLSMSTTDFGNTTGSILATGYHPRANPMRLVLPGWVVGPSAGRWTSLQPFAVDGLAYGGLVGTASDAARLLQMHLANGIFDGVRLLPADSVESMRQIDAPGGRYDLGLGWFRPRTDRDAKPSFVEHLGGGAGFHSVMRLYPSEGVGAVVMGNATAFDAAAVSRLALEYR